MSEGQSKSVAKNLLAGGAAGAIEAVIMYPTEYVKTQMQLQSTQLKKGALTKPKFTGIWDCVRVTIHGCCLLFVVYCLLICLVWLCVCVFKANILIVAILYTTYKCKYKNVHMQYNTIQYNVLYKYTNTQI